MHVCSTTMMRIKVRFGKFAKISYCKFVADVFNSSLNIQSLLPLTLPLHIHTAPQPLSYYFTGTLMANYARQFYWLLVESP